MTGNWIDRGPANEKGIPTGCRRKGVQCHPDFLIPISVPFVPHFLLTGLSRHLWFQYRTSPNHREKTSSELGIPLTFSLYQRTHSPYWLIVLWPTCISPTCISPTCTPLSIAIFMTIGIIHLLEAAHLPTVHIPVILVIIIVINKNWLHFLFLVSSITYLVM